MRSEHYNNYPKWLENELKEKFKKPVAFRLVNLKDDEDNPGKTLYPAYRNISFKDHVKIVSPEGETEYIYIAYITGTQADGAANVGRDIAWGAFNQGTMILDPSRAKDRLKFNYLYLSNFNASNPNRDTNVDPVYELVNSEEKARLSREQRKVSREAIIIAAGLSDEQTSDIFSVVDSRNPKSVTIEEQHDVVEQYAEDHPENFMKVYKSRTTQMISLIDEAIKAKVIQNDKKNSIFVLQGKTILEYVIGQTNPTPKELLAAKLLSDNRLLMKVETLLELEQV